MKIIAFLSPLVVILVLCIIVWRWADYRANSKVWTHLVARQPSQPALFNSAMLVDLPPVAQRFFNFAIQPGTPLFKVAEISMQGEFSLGSKEKPNYMPMRAQQILAAPYGFVWKLKAGKGMMRFSGADAAEGDSSWSHFWFHDMAPVALAGGNSDHLQSSFGRYIAEAVFWTPAALLPKKLPNENIQWEQLNDTTARVTVKYSGLVQAVDLVVDTEGRPSQVTFQRWSNANPQKIFQWQPFGGFLSEYKDFDGFQLPTRVEAGNFFETDNYFPFYCVNVSSVRFPQTKGD